jgi:hypothetical protein
MAVLALPNIMLYISNTILEIYNKYYKGFP